jgi:pilus assembly protein CpaB
VVIAAVVGSQPATGETTGSPDALLLTVTPQDALVLKYVKDAGGTVDIVLRAPGAEQPATIEPVDVDYVIKKYQIPTAPGR